MSANERELKLPVTGGLNGDAAAYCALPERATHKLSGYNARLARARRVAQASRCLGMTKVVVKISIHRGLKAMPAAIRREDTS